MVTAALLAKIAVPPVLVALMSLAARRWGPTFGGLIMGLPWMTGPVLFFLGLDKGPAFLIGAAKGAVIAVWSIAAFIMAFGYSARWFGWKGSLAAAVIAYVATGLASQTYNAPLELACAVSVALLVGCYWLLPRPQTSAPLPRPSVWDIPARMAATFALVSGIMLAADLLGPQRSGLIASFPVILTVVGVFTQAQLGRDSLLRVLRGISLSLLAFTGFFTVVSGTTGPVGQWQAYALASVIALMISGAFIAWNQRKSLR